MSVIANYNTTAATSIGGPGPGSTPSHAMNARWRGTGLRRDECVCDACGKIHQGEPVDGNYGEIWSLWASWR